MGAHSVLPTFDLTLLLPRFGSNSPGTFRTIMERYLAFLPLIALFAASGIACSGSPPTPSPGAVEVWEDMIAAVEALDSVHVEVDWVV